MKSNKENTVLHSTLAGAWYPGDAASLRRMLQSALDGLAVDSSAQKNNILLLPHAGYEFSLPTAIYGIQRIYGKNFKRVILLAPSHRTYLLNQISAPQASAVSSPLGTIELDQQGIAEIQKNFPLKISDNIHQQEHAAQILYPLLQFALQDFVILPLIVGVMNDKALTKAAAAIKRLWNEETLLVISTDFTHYGRNFQFAPFGKNAEEKVKEFDLKAFELLQKQDKNEFMSYLEKNEATICGQFPLALMLTMLDDNANLSLLNYSNSLQKSLRDDSFVCYLSAAGYLERGIGTDTTDDTLLSISEQKLLLSFARRAIEYTLAERKACPEDYFAAESTATLNKDFACFVTLEKRSSGNLRGCIGEIIAYRPLYQSVTARAVDAAFRDSRFSPLSANELSDLRIEISVLTAPQEVASYNDIEIGRHGVIFSMQGRNSVFLPQVAPEQGWDLETTLSQLALKAGLSANAWRNSRAKFSVFEAFVFGED